MFKHTINLYRTCLMLFGVVCSSLTYAANLEDIEFFSLSDDVVQIKLSFDDVPPQPGSYTISDPARIAIDLPGVINKLPERKYALDFDNTNSVIVLEAGGRTRLIVNMIDLVDYRALVDGKTVLLNIGSSEVSSNADTISGTSQQSFSSVDGSSSRSHVSELNFQRGEGGEGRLLISLTDPTIDVDVAKQGQYINIKLFDTFLSDEQRHTYDVIDFATAVKEFSANQEGNNTTIRLLPDPSSDYLAYQTDDMFVVSVTPLVGDSKTGAVAFKEFQGDRLSLNFQSIEVRAVLQLIAEFTGLNLVASDAVTGAITLRLDNVPWDQALDIVLKTKGLAKRINGNVMLVAPATEIAEQERIELEASKQLIELTPVQTEHFKILYANATTLSSMLTGDSDGLLSDRGSVLVDERTNSLIVTDTGENLDEVRELLVLLDIPVKQVMIEARIVSANDDFSRELGIRWGGADIKNKTIVSGSLDSVNDLTTQVGDRAEAFNTAFQGFVDQGLSTADAASQAASSLEAFSVNYPDSLLVDLGVGGAPSSLALSYLGDTFNVSAELSALESNGQGEVVSQPKVVTGDKQAATIKAGQEVGFQQATASGATSIAFKEAVLQLDVTPNITPDNRILMDLTVTQDSIAGFVSGENNSQVPILDTVELITQVLINNGETIVLGGIFEQTDLENVVKTPLLGDIPYLGRLFKRTVVTKQKRETLIFITPRIISSDLVN